MKLNSFIIRIGVVVGFLLSLLSLQTNAQTLSGKVVSENGAPLPFATIKFGKTQQGIIADLNGLFTVEWKPDLTFLEISYLNYTTLQVPVHAGSQNMRIVLSTLPANLETVVVKTTGNKLRRILNAAVNNRPLHNPDNYEWYRCKVYYKMTADVNFNDPSFAKDTGAGFADFQKRMELQHVMVTETISKRTWKYPSKLQEEVIATRMSGFEKSLISGLVTDVLPFHAYTDFIMLNGKEFHNPISKGLFQRFQFTLADELLVGKDSVWVINFIPKQSGELSGTVFIHSDGFAISRIIAHSIDTLLNRHMGIEQQYIKSQGRWFPEKLNYALKFRAPFAMEMRGTSRIDSIEWQPENNFKFDKGHTVKLLPGADMRTDSVWQEIRPEELREKEKQTYVMMDSIGKKAKISKVVNYVQKLMDGKFPINKMDILLPREYSYNNFEGSRFGLGLQTNEKISKRFSVGAWGGYGTGDKLWKYGAFAEWYGDAFKESVVQLSYSNDLRDPGRLQIHPELDKNTLRMLLLSRADRVEAWKMAIKNKFGYLSGELTVSAEKIQPQYAYEFDNAGKPFRSFTVNEASLNLRYAYGERTTPMLGKYYATGTKYPILYGKVNTGEIENTGISYTQVIMGFSWQKTINRFGSERVLVTAGTTFSKQGLPISKLFAGNGFVLDRQAIYFFGGMQTMRPYDYYTDRFVNFYFQHTFPGKLYKLPLGKSISSEPTLGLNYNLLVGGLENREAHKQINFKVPDNGYHETGIMLNNLVRIKAFGLGYMGLQAGYFYHFDKTRNLKENGRFVYGLNFEF